MVGRPGEGEMGSSIYIGKNKVLPRYFFSIKWQEHINYHLKANKES